MGDNTEIDFDKLVGNIQSIKNTYLSDSGTISTIVGKSSISSTDQLQLQTSLTNLQDALNQFSGNLEDTVLDYKETVLSEMQTKMSQIDDLYDTLAQQNQSTLDKTEKKLTGHKRLIHNNEYYAKRYNALTFIVKMITLIALVLMLVVYLGNRKYISDGVYNLLPLFILAPSILYIFYLFVDVWRRDKFDYDEYQWNYVPPRDDDKGIETFVNYAKLEDIDNVNKTKKNMKKDKKIESFSLFGV
jgi:hypothetical protein